MLKALLHSWQREIRILSSRPIYMIMMAIVPMACALFFIGLMSSGLPMKVPTAIVDLDQSPMSRGITRSLNATELIDIQYAEESYDAALEKVREGKIFGFFVIPENFESDAVAGREPTLDYYSNMTYFVPGTLSFKGFKTMAVSAAGSIVRTKLTGFGLSNAQIAPLMQPVVIGTKGIGNPWINYSYYLSPSFTFATLSLLIMIMTAFSITTEIKHGTSVDWLKRADGSMSIALVGKLLPHAIIFISIAFAIEGIMFGFLHFPMNGSIGWLLLATALMVFACQAFALFVCSLLPNPRLSLSVVCLLGVLAYSFTGLSFPVEKMYGAIAIFSYISPVRYLFLIYINTALNGFDVYYARYSFIGLLLFLYVGGIFIYRLKKACLKPVYVE